MIDEQTLHGVLTPNGFSTVQVNIEDIETIEVEKIDGVKTTLAVVGTAVIIVPLALIALLFSGS